MVTVPQMDGEHLFLPATLPIDGNVPGSYMAYGDSITDGCGSSDMQGYRSILENDLRGHFNGALVVNQSFPGTQSDYGASRIRANLRAVRPAYALILYGTNDWNEHECRSDFPCFTIESLRTMVRASEEAHALPFLATIIPANTGFDQRAPPERNQWVARMNDLIRPMAAQEGAVLVDLYAAFMAQPNFRQLFFDHVHPNDMGYAVMAEEWFRAITQTSEMTQPMSLDLGLIPSIDPVHRLVPAPPARQGTRRPLAQYHRT
jgi:lysophospholipase L1-like esterase